MTTWLVTGGAGFIGGNFVLDAVGRGIKVVNLDALTYAGNRDTLASLDGDANHVFVHGDIGDRALVARLLAEHRPDAVVNFAAESHVDRSIDGPAAFIQTNVVGTLALLEAVRDHWKSLEGETRQAFRFLHVSTNEVYGSIHRRHRAIEFKKFLTKLDNTVPADLDVHLICDNYSTHKSPTVTKWLAAHPRFHMHFTPTYSSWLNQVERWFGLLTDQKLRRGVHRSIQALEKDIREWIADWNDNPRPFNWTKTADEIFERLGSYLQRIPGAGH